MFEGKVFKVVFDRIDVDGVLLEYRHDVGGVLTGKRRSENELNRTKSGCMERLTFWWCGWGGAAMVEIRSNSGLL